MRGEVLVAVESDVPGRFEPGASVLVGPAPWRALRVRAVRPHRSLLLVGFEGVDDRDEAELLQGKELEVERSQVPEAPEGFYYFFQLIGCRCRDAGAGELGEVVDVLEDGGGLLLVVRGNETELLIPFVQSFLRRVDMDAREIDLELPDGLIETCASRS